MLNVTPFRAVRPSRDKAHLVASRSYVSYTPKQLRSKLIENPFSFLHIIHPDMSATKLHKTSDLDARFEQVRKKYDDFLRDEILERDETPSFYLYRQIKNGHPFIGIIGAVAVEDYLNGKIKVHEQTLAKREETFVKYLDITNINAEPVLLMAKNNKSIEDIFIKYTDLRPEYDFTTTNKVRHQLWVISAKTDIDVITQAYAAMDALYIADGHHRSSSSARLFEKRKSVTSTGKEPWNHCLAYILDERNVRIYEFNRVVKDLNSMSKEAFLQALSQSFYVNEAPNYYKPGVKGEFSMYLQKQWYSLNLKNQSGQLDAQVLSDLVLKPLLGILDLRKDKRISFMEGPRGMEGLKHAVDKNKDGVAFGLYPVAIEELKQIADNGLSMPPKSTWVEPKLRSGLVVYELIDEKNESNR
jgi:uncharacterized protein (DUF1015 family)